jgi:hypothetical protein
MQMWINHHPAAFILLVVTYSVGLWTGVMYLTARFGGWSTLAARFRLQDDFSGQRWSGQSARLRGISSYNNCLIVGADQAGLFVRPLFPFRVAHPPLFVPWSEITLHPPRLLWGRYWSRLRELHLGQTEQVPFRITTTLAARLQQAAGTSWPKEPVG